MISYQDYKFSGISWFGDIPSHWILTKNRFGFKKISNGVNDSDSTPVLSLTTNGVKIKEDLTFGKTSESYIGHQLVKRGNIVFTPRDFDQTPILSDVSKYDGCISNLYIVDETNEKLLNSFVNYYWYGLKYSVDYFKNFSHGMRYSFNRFQFDEIPLLLPPLNEQKIIVKFLDKRINQIDLIIKKIQIKIELLIKKRTSILNFHVIKGVQNDVEMKNSGIDWIGEIPKNWKIIKIKYLVSTKITDGPHETPIFSDEGIPFLSVEGIVGNKINFSQVRGYISKELHEFYSKKSKPQKFDVLLVKSGSTTGKSAIVETDSEFNIWSPLCILRSDLSKIDPYFMFNAVQSDYFKTQVETGWSYGTQPNIGMGVIENLFILLPPLEEQKKINKNLQVKLSTHDRLLKLEEKRIELFKNYRQSLISSLVMGRFKITEDMI